MAWLRAVLLCRSTEAALIALFGADRVALQPGREDVDRRRGVRMSLLGSILARMTRFDDQDLSDSEFRECDLTRARLIGVVMQDAVIDGLVTNLMVNGVEVSVRRGRAGPATSGAAADPVGRSGRTAPGLARVAGRVGGDARAAAKDAQGFGTSARRRRVVGGGDPAAPGVCARLLVRSLLPGLDPAAHRLRGGSRLRARARAGPGPGRNPEPRPGAGCARPATCRAGPLAIGRDR